MLKKMMLVLVLLILISFGSLAYTCDNGLDDDNDGKIDLADEDCYNDPNWDGELESFEPEEPVPEPVSCTSNQCKADPFCVDIDDYFIETTIEYGTKTIKNKICGSNKQWLLCTSNNIGEISDGGEKQCLFVGNNPEWDLTQGVQCDPNDPSKVVIWTYILPLHQDALNNQDPSYASISCCKATQCEFQDVCYDTNTILPFPDPAFENRFVCGDYNSWFYCETEGQWSGFYKCDGLEWKLTEKDCSNKIDDDHSGLTDCQDPTCEGVVVGPNGEKCEPLGETTCNDGFDNDGDTMVIITPVSISPTATFPETQVSAPEVQVAAEPVAQEAQQIIQILPAVCGDNKCESIKGEDSQTCLQDCPLQISFQQVIISTGQAARLPEQKETGDSWLGKLVNRIKTVLWGDEALVGKAGESQTQQAQEPVAIQQPEVAEEAPLTEQDFTLAINVCGNNICEPNADETWKNCPQDCPPPEGIDCADADCIGKLGPENNVCCLSDGDCPSGAICTIKKECGVIPKAPKAPSMLPEKEIEKFSYERDVLETLNQCQVVKTSGTGNTVCAGLGKVCVPFADDCTKQGNKFVCC